MQLHIFATGSTGNCYVLKDNAGRMLMLDCGVPMQAVYRAVDFKTTALDACLCSHVHSDHLKGARDMLRAFMPVYMTGLTAELGKIDRHSPTLHICREDEQLKIGKWRVLPFDTYHDAPGSVGFLIKHTEEEVTIAYVTDTGHIKYVFPNLNVLLVECNYIDDIIDGNREDIGERFMRLKETHMGLNRLKSYLSKVDKSQLRHVVLLHLSDSNSNAEQMQKDVHELTGADVHIADAGMIVNLDETPF